MWQGHGGDGAGGSRGGLRVRAQGRVLCAPVTEEIVPRVS